MLGPGNQFRTRDASALAVFLTDLEPRKRSKYLLLNTFLPFSSITTDFHACEQSKEYTS